MKTHENRQAKQNSIDLAIPTHSIRIPATIDEK